MKIKIDKVVELANNYLLAENEYHAFAKTLKYCWMPSNSTEDQVRYAEHWKETNTYYDSVRIVCQMLDIDINKLIALVKATNRHEKKDEISSLRLSRSVWRRGTRAKIFGKQ